MVSEMTGSALPMRLAHPAATPSVSRSKRGVSIDGISSLRGPPDLISSSGTVCCEKSVPGHSARQPPGSTGALPGAALMAAATSVAASTIARMPCRNLNCAPLGSFIARLSASIAICPVSILVIRSTARKGYRSAAQRRRFPLSAWTARMLPNPLVFEKDQSDCRHISDPGRVTFPVVGTNLGEGAPNRPPDSDRACRKVDPNRRNRNVQSHANRTRRRRLCSSRGIARRHVGYRPDEQGRHGKNDEGKSSQDHEGA